MKEIYYDEISEGYNRLYGEEQTKKINIIKDYLKLNKNTKILDIGCGTGISTNFNCECIGIDPSKKLIEIAKKNDKNPLHKYIIQKAEDLSKLKFNNNEFDYVICVSAIHHINNLEKCINEINRITNKLVVTILNKLSQKQKIINSINKKFNIKKIVEENKDTIIFCEAKYEK
jgi:ubiquinone/menaquinone biosynthesis C-methylase UbiE